MAVHFFSTNNYYNVIQDVTEKNVCIPKCKKIIYTDTVFFFYDSGR